MENEGTYVAYKGLGQREFAGQICTKILGKWRRWVIVNTNGKKVKEQSSLSIHSDKCSTSSSFAQLASLNIVSLDKNFYT
jgi:hypothetical protein